MQDATELAQPVGRGPRLHRVLGTSHAGATGRGCSAHGHLAGDFPRGPVPVRAQHHARGRRHDPGRFRLEPRHRAAEHLLRDVARALPPSPLFGVAGRFFTYVTK